MKIRVFLESAGNFEEQEILKKFYYKRKDFVPSDNKGKVQPPMKI